MPVSLQDVLVPGRTAVLTMEMQRAVIGDLSTIPALRQEVEGAGTIASAARLLAGARAAGVPVVHCTVSFRPDRRGSPANAPMLALAARAPENLLDGSPSAELVPELGPEPTDLIAHRRHGVTPFTGTDLDALLRSLGVETVVVAGVSVNIGVFGLCVEAVNAGYRVCVASDAVAGVPAAYAAEVMANSIRLLATLATVDDITACWS